MHWRSSYKVKVTQWKLFSSKLCVVLSEGQTVNFLRRNNVYLLISRAIAISTKELWITMYWLPEQSHKCLGARHGITSFWAPIAYISWSITRWSFSSERVSIGRIWNVPGDAPCNNRWLSISYNITVKMKCQNSKNIIRNLYHMYWLMMQNESWSLERRLDGFLHSWAYSD